MPGTIVKRLGPLTYLVRVGQDVRHIHVDHLLRSGETISDHQPEYILRQMKPTAAPPNQIQVTLPDGVLPNVNPVVSPVQSDQSLDSPNISVTQDNTTPPTPTDKPPDTLTTPRRYPLRDRKPKEIFDL